MCLTLSDHCLTREKIQNLKSLIKINFGLLSIFLDVFTMFLGYSSRISKDSYKYYSIDNISVGTLFQTDTSFGTQLCQIYSKPTQFIN